MVSYLRHVDCLPKWISWSRIFQACWYFHFGFIHHLAAPLMILYIFFSFPLCREEEELGVFNLENVTISILNVSMRLLLTISCQSFWEHRCSLYVCKLKVYNWGVLLNSCLGHCNHLSHYLYDFPLLVDTFVVCGWFIVYIVELYS